jgi:hypothetical protein
MSNFYNICELSLCAQFLTNWQIFMKFGYDHYNITGHLNLVLISYDSNCSISDDRTCDMRVIIFLVNMFWNKYGKKSSMMVSDKDGFIFFFFNYEILLKASCQIWNL